MFDPKMFPPGPQSPFEEGEGAAVMRLKEVDNPYPAGSPDYARWLEGYRSWKRANAANGNP